MKRALMLAGGARATGISTSGAQVADSSRAGSASVTAPSPGRPLCVGVSLERGPAVVVSAVAVVPIGSLIASCSGEDW